MRFDVDFYAEICRANDAYFTEEGFDMAVRPRKRRKITSEEQDEYNSDSEVDEDEA